VELDRKSCYRVLLARDSRYDGRFFTCVKTTGIYCRPVCPARTPKIANVAFVSSAAAAQEAGYRPCLRCRPERSPDLTASRGTSVTVSRALSLIERGALDEGDVAALASRLGLGERQLRRLFHQHLGASPVTVAQTRRVLLAKQLIHDSALSMTEVALASGFSSLRRFNETFKDLYGRPPSALRRRTPEERVRTSAVELFLPYQAPYDFVSLLAFLAARAITGVEQVQNGVYMRVFELADSVGSVAVSDVPERSALRVRVRLQQLAALPSVIARVRHVFDLGSDPRTIADELARDPLLAEHVKARPGLRVPGAWEGFEIAVRGILGQQITVTAATQLASKVAQRMGKRVEDAFVEPGLTHAFPGPERFERELVEQLGMPRARALALQGLAQAARKDPTLFGAGQDLEQALAKLTSLPGIGPWTAQYIAMRALAQSDAFPVGDIGLMRALGVDGVRPTPKMLLARAEAWRPWRAYAALHLWTADARHQASVTRVRQQASVAPRAREGRRAALHAKGSGTGRDSRDAIAS
jgi:AraC family transcriptional regulator of adaptative response / DNA-3-methyladenine glycosylase II